MTNEKIPRPSGAHVLILDNLGLKPQAKQPDPFGVYIGIGWSMSPLIIHSDPKIRYNQKICTFVNYKILKTTSIHQTNIFLS